MVHEVARDDRLAAPRADADADMAGCVAGRGLEPHLAGDGVFESTGRPARVEDGPHRVGHDAPVLVAGAREPVRELGAAEEVARVREVGTQRPSTSRVFQPTWSTCRWVQSTTSTDSGG
jgi:hypothetical protein